MNGINEAFDAMFKGLQKTGDAYDYPSAAWSVIEECKKAVQSRLEEVNRKVDELEMDAERFPAGYDGGVQTGSAVHLYFDTQENANVWFSEFMDKVDTAMQANKEANA